MVYLSNSFPGIGLSGGTPCTPCNPHALRAPLGGSSSPWAGSERGGGQTAVVTPSALVGTFLRNGRGSEFRQRAQHQALVKPPARAPRWHSLPRSCMKRTVKERASAGCVARVAMPPAMRTGDVTPRSGASVRRLRSVGHACLQVLVLCGFFVAGAMARRPRPRRRAACVTRCHHSKEPWHLKCAHQACKQCALCGGDDGSGGNGQTGARGGTPLIQVSVVGGPEGIGVRLSDRGSPSSAYGTADAGAGSTSAAPRVASRYVRVQGDREHRAHGCTWGHPARRLCVQRCSATPLRGRLMGWTRQMRRAWCPAWRLTFSWDCGHPLVPCSGGDDDDDDGASRRNGATPALQGTCPQLLEATCLPQATPIIAKIRGLSVKACCAECVDNAKCVAWTFNTRYSNACFLRGVSLLRACPRVGERPAAHCTHQLSAATPTPQRPKFTAVVTHRGPHCATWSCWVCGGVVVWWCGCVAGCVAAWLCVLGCACLRVYVHVCTMAVRKVKNKKRPPGRPTHAPRCAAGLPRQQQESREQMHLWHYRQPPPSFHGAAAG